MHLNYETIGKRSRLLRQQQHLSQMELAEMPIQILRLPSLTKNEKNAYMTANRFWIRAVYLCIFGNMRTLPEYLLTTALCAGTSTPT